MRRYFISIIIFYSFLLLAFSVFATDSTSDVESVDVEFWDRIDGNIEDYIEVVNDYGLRKNGLHEFMIIKNISKDTPVAIHVSGTTEKAQTEGSISVLGPNETSILHLFYPEIGDEDVVDVTHQFLLTQPVCEPILHDIESKIEENKIIITNNSEYRMFGSNVYILKFEDDVLTDFVAPIAGDERQIVEPGDSISVDNPFDSGDIKYYIIASSQRAEN